MDCKTVLQIVCGIYFVNNGLLTIGIKCEILNILYYCKNNLKSKNENVDILNLF